MKQGQFVTKNSKHGHRTMSSTSGQAMIEYVLLLFITISLVFLARNLISGVKTFIDGYMGSYVRCLMEHGELPAMGVSDSTLKSNEDTGYACSKQYSFSVQKGFFAATSESGGGSSGGSGSNSSTASKSNKASSGKGNVESSASASEGTTSGASSDSVARRERKRRNNGGRDGGSSGSVSESQLLRTSSARTADGDDGGDSGSRTRVIAEVGSEGSIEESSETARLGRSRSRGITGKMAEEIEKNSKIAQTNSKAKAGVSAVVADLGDAPGPRRSIARMPDEKKLEEDQGPPEEPFSFGKFFKLILIIALIIIIVIFFGGQLLNYSNSDN